MHETLSVFVAVVCDALNTTVLIKKCIKDDETTNLNFNIIYTPIFVSNYACIVFIIVWVYGIMLLC